MDERREKSMSGWLSEVEESKRRMEIERRMCCARSARWEAKAKGGGPG